MQCGVYSADYCFHNALLSTIDAILHVSCSHCQHDNVENRVENDVYRPNSWDTFVLGIPYSTARQCAKTTLFYIPSLPDYSCVIQFGLSGVMCDKSPTPVTGYGKQNFNQ